MEIIRLNPHKTNYVIAHKVLETGKLYLTPQVYTYKHNAERCLKESLALYNNTTLYTSKGLSKPFIVTIDCTILELNKNNIGNEEENKNAN